MSDETDMTSKSNPDATDANPQEDGASSSERGPEETTDQTRTEGETDEAQQSVEGESSVFATPKSISTGPPNPFSNRSPPRIREPDGNPRPVLAPSRFGASPFASDSNRPSPLGKSRLLLRPSLLSQVANGVGDSASATTSAFGSPVPNPFLRASAPGRETEEPTTNGSLDSNHSKKDGISSTNLFRTPSTESSSHPRVATSVTSSNANPTFVFGQNIHERVLVAEPAEKPESSESKVESAANGESQTGLLFSSAATSQVTTSTKTLNESAQEYEAARAAKRRYDEVEIVTGEEEETNVLQVHCKLHVFDKGVWAERGRGHLRLNDKVVDQQMTSRVVMRCQGTLRIVLNSKIWPDMTLDRMSDKSIRMTGYDNGQIKIFLITASPKDADLLHSALEYRLANVRSVATSQTKREDEERDSGSKRRRESEESQEEAGEV